MGCRSRHLLGGLVLVITLISPVLAQTTQQPGYSGSPSATAARALYDRGRYEEARAMLDALIESGVRTGEVLYYRGLLEPDMMTALTRYFVEVTRRFPGTEWGDRAMFQVASYRYATGAYVTARGFFGEVAWRQGDTPLGREARYWRAMTWTHASAAADSLRRAVGLLKVVAAEATTPHVLGLSLISIGELSLRLGQADSAYAYAARVMESPFLEDLHPRGMAVQGAALDVLGRSEDARMVYQSIANRFADTWEGEVARGWLSRQRESAVQARLDTLRAGGEYDPIRTTTRQGEWTLQVGAYSNLANASQLVMELKRKSYDAWHTSSRVEGRIYVVVLVGHFETQAEAEAFGAAMVERQDVTEFIVKIKP